EWDDVGVADYYADLPERHAELVGGDLGQGRLVALAVRHLPGEQRNDAVFLEPKAHGLGAQRAAGTVGRARAGSGLDERCHADAAGTAVASRFGLPTPKRGKVHELGEPLQRLPRGDSDQRTPRDHAGRRIGARGDVTQPDLDRIEAQIFGDDVEDALP